MGSKPRIFFSSLGNWLEWIAFFFLLAAIFFASRSRAAPEIIYLYEKTPYINYGWHIFLTRSLIIFSLVLTLLSISLTGYLRLPSWKITVPLLAYLGLVTISISISLYPFASIQAAVNMCLWCSSFFVAVHLCHLQRRRVTLIYSVYLLALAMSIYGIAQALGYYPSYLDLYGSIESFYYQSNHYAGFLDIIIPLTLTGTLYQKRLGPKILLGVLTLLLLVNLVLTDSRGSWIATGCVCLGLLVFWVNQTWSKVSKYFALILALLSIGVVIWLLISYLTNIKTSLMNPYNILLDGSLQQRLTIWRVSLAAISNQPWLGWGAGNFIETIAMHRSTLSMLELKPLFGIIVTYAHNEYLQVAVETGLLSLMAFLYFWLAVLLKPISKNFSSPEITYGISAGLITILLHGFVESNITIIPATAILAYTLAGSLHACKVNPD